MDDVVFQEKLRRPEPLGLSRTRLERQLLDDHGPSATLVLAPPGSGKTTLLTHVASSQSRAPTAWYRAGPEDVSEAAFVAHVSEAVNRAADVTAVAVSTFEELIAQIERVGDRRIQLIIDDVHELASTPAEATLERFLRLRPRSIRVLMGSRRPLTLNTPRLLVSGDLVMLDGDALRFRSWEVEELFRFVYLEPLPPEAAAALTQRTGGWAAGLQLFHLATRGKPEAARAQAVAELGGRSRLIRSYLTRNVLDELDPGRREFLLVTSTLGTLTGELCDALLGNTGSAAVLEDLEHSQFFTTSTDDGRTYRYHQVLQTLLEGLLIEDRGLRETRALYARSAVLLDEGGHHREAMRAYALADDWGSVGRLLQTSSTGMPAAAELWTGGIALPVDDPWLALGRARRLLRAGAIEAAVQAYRQAESLWDDADFRAVCSTERGAAAVWTSDALSGPPDSALPPDASRRIVDTIRRGTRRLPELAHGPDVVRSGEPLADGLVSLLAGRFAEAHDQLTPVWTDRERDPGQRLCAGLGVVVSELAYGFAEGHIAGVDPVLEDIVLTAEVEEQPWIARIARGLQGSVVFSSRRGRSAAVDPTVLAAPIEECERVGDAWGAVLLGIVIGAAQLRAGADEAAERLLRHAATSADGLDAPVLKVWALSLATAAAGRLGRADADRRVAEVESLARATGALETLTMLDRLAATVSTVATTATAPALATRDAPMVEDRVATTRWQLCCLGGFSLSRDGHVMALPALRPRAHTLLLLLAIHYGRDVHRERLIDLLWPDAPLEAGKHRLQVAASSVRHCLAQAGCGDNTVHRHGDAYRLDLDEAEVDVRTLEDALEFALRSAAAGDTEGALARWDVALDSYRGELLPEVGPAEWVVVERERLRLATANGAVTAARLRRRLGQLAAAQQCARRAIELDPWSDTAWRLLADVQEEFGDPTAATATRVKHAEVRSELISLEVT